MTNKFLTLARLSAEFPVPPLIGLDAARLRRLWRNYDEVAATAAAVLADIHHTAGAFLDKHLGRLTTLGQIQWAATHETELADWLASAGLDWDESLAVRSSAAAEDGAQHSFAGIFLSRLGVQGLSTLKQAIKEVWLSAFSRAAVLERLRSGDAVRDVGMTIIVQRMVAARWAGVAFSHDPVNGKPEPVVEAVAGLADRMVSGDERALSARVAEREVHCEDALRGHEPMLREVAGLACRLADGFGGPVDIEWAADDERVWLVQARPVTTLGVAQASSEPTLQWTDLYLAEEEAIEPFRPLPGFAQYFRSKRADLARFAISHNVAAGRALLVRANRAGLAQPAAADVLGPLITADRVVLDLSDQIRQQIVAREDWLVRVREFSSQTPLVFVVREFIAGEIGLISQMLSDGRVICEYSPEGLLAINRGTAGTSSLVLPDTDTKTGAPLAAEQQAVMLAITRAAQDVFGSIQLEWVLYRSRLMLIDFSPVRSAFELLTEGGLRTISPGYAEGECIVVEADRRLQEVSVSARISIGEIPDSESLGPAVAQLVARLRGMAHKPIVVSPRPYAALAAVLPYVKGFVFEQASMLCHLSILLREHGLPAVESAQIYRDAHHSSRIAINATA